LQNISRALRNVADNLAALHERLARSDKSQDWLGLAILAIFCAVILSMGETPPETKTMAPEDIALRAVTEKWEESVDRIPPPMKWRIQGEKGDTRGTWKKYQGKVCIMVFTSGIPYKSPNWDTIQKYADNPEVEVVVVTPVFSIERNRNKAAEELDTMIREIVPSIPEKAVIYSDPWDSIRWEHKIYSCPLIVLDRESRPVWRTRVNDRKTPDDPKELETVMEAVLRGIEEAASPHPPMSTQIEEHVLFDFENGLDGWTTSGDAFPTIGSEKHSPGLVAGYSGSQWLSSFTGNFVVGKGVAISPEFEITMPYLHFLAGGGDLPQKHGIVLLIEEDGRFVRQYSPEENTYHLKPAYWNVNPFLGKKARLIAYDAGAEELRDGILVDQVVLSNSDKIPESFADTHDPNNPEHAAKASAEAPEEWRNLQAGKFYQEIATTRRFTIGWKSPAEVIGRSSKLTFAIWGLPAKTPAQTVPEQDLWIQIGEENPPRSRSKVQKVPGDFEESIITATERSSRRSENIYVGMDATVELHSLETKWGTPPKLPARPRTEGQEAWIGKEERELYRSEGMDRMQGESDSTYLLRAWRFLQRYYADGDPWAGWPSGEETIILQARIPFLGNAFNPSPDVYEKYANFATIGFTKLDDYIRRRGECGSVARLADMCAAAGITARVGQGFWLKDAGIRSEIHARTWIFTNESGWILLDDHKHAHSQYGGFTQGFITGDNFLQFIPNDGVAGGANLAIPWFEWITKEMHEAKKPE
jgi:hypothetical protein